MYASSVDSVYLSVGQVYAVPGDFGATGGEKLGRRHPVAREEAVHVRSWGIAGCACINDRDAPPGPAKHKGCTKSGGAAPDHGHVVCLCVHSGSPPRQAPRKMLTCQRLARLLCRSTNPEKR